MRDVISAYLTRNTWTRSRVIPTWPQGRVFPSQLVRANHPDGSQWPPPHQATCRAAYMNQADLCIVGIISTDVAEGNLVASYPPRGPCGRCLGGLLSWLVLLGLPITHRQNFTMASPLVKALTNSRKWSLKKETEKAWFQDQRYACQCGIVVNERLGLWSQGSWVDTPPLLLTNLLT